MGAFLLAFLILINAIFAMSEMALVSSRKGKLRRLADKNIPGAHSALRLREEPSAFLSTVQVGITTVGILSGAIGENALVDPLSGLLLDVPILAAYATPIAMGCVVFGLTYVSVVIGELVPKRLALLAPERIAAIIGAPMWFLSRVARPIVWLLSASSSFFLRLLGAPQREGVSVSNDEIQVLMEEGAHAGVFHQSEQAIVSNVLRLDEQKVSALMTPRQDIYFVDIQDGDAVIRQRLSDSPYTRVVLCRGGLDHVIGVLRISDLIKPLFENEPLRLTQKAYLPLYIPRGVSVPTLVEHFRRAGQLMALVVDEYGVIEGVVTLADVMAAIVGELPSRHSEEDEIVQRKDGSWLVSGSVGGAQFREVLGIEMVLPGEKEHVFQTMGGFMMYMLRRIPAVADQIQVGDYLFEVVDMDRNRVDKILVTKCLPDT